MAKLKWDQTGEKVYETGTDRGVLFPMGDAGTYENGVAWSGLTAVNQSPSGAEPTPLYADNIKYLELMSNEDFGFSIEAYTYPDEFAACNGEAELAAGVSIGQQARKAFGMTYRSIIGNDVKNNEYGYKIHLIYGAKAAPSEKAYATVNDSPEAMTLSWECTTTPVEVEGFKPTAYVCIDSTKVDAEKLKALEDKLYGTESEEATLPMPAELVTMFAA